ncbi:MAG: fluoride efflux transporter CrcB [Bacteroidetes bacterium]|nr:fluoride efflux transporter CrcB [Bacteroidota bacterium]
MQTLMMIGAGSFIGGVMRYLLSQAMQTKMNVVFPYGTFTVNVIGCFAIGAVIALADRQSMSNDWKLFLATGICGGFTTFSAFSMETLSLLRGGQVSVALLYVAGSVLLGLAATWAGYALAH